MVKYDLINPCILGQFNSSYEVNNPLDAAKQFWNDLTPHITNNLPEMYITLQAQEGGSLHHFKIHEKLSENGKMANYSISEIKLKLAARTKRDFLEELMLVKEKRLTQIDRQIGGAHQLAGSADRNNEKRYKAKDSSTVSSDLSSSSSSLSSSEDSDNDDEYFNFSKYKRMSQPIVYWWYTPYIYKVTRFFTPTFNVPLTPYVHIWNPIL